MTDRELILLLPGLFGPDLDPGADFDTRGNAATRAREAEVLTAGLELPKLVRLLSRAQQAASDRVGQSLEALYFKSFELTLAINEDLPVASLTAAIDGMDPGKGIWLRADPVHLRPDLGRLILHDSRDLDIQMDEARQLAAELKAEFRALNLELLVVSPARWYLRLKVQPRFTSVSPASAHGRDVDSCLLRGADARHWHQIQNQIQMLLHQSPVNSVREAKGKPAINSLWFWGAGNLPDSPARAWAQVCGDDQLLEGLARYSGSPYVEMPTDAGQWLAAAPTGQCLIMSHTAARAVYDQDSYAWREALESFEQRWFGPLLKALTERQLKTLTVDGGSGLQFVSSARDARKWWRRDKPLQVLIGAARAPCA